MKFPGTIKLFILFLEACSQDSGDTWKQPPEWNGTDPVLYRSFDNADGLVFMEGTQQINTMPLVSGQVKLTDRVVDWIVA